MTGGNTVQVLAHADIAEVRPCIGWVAVAPQATAVLKAYGFMLGRDLKNMWIEIAKRSWEQQRRIVEVDHRFHSVLHVLAFGHALFFKYGDTCHCLHCGSAFRVGLVIAEVIFRTDIDKADGQVARCHCWACDAPQCGSSKNCGGCAHKASTV